MTLIPIKILLVAYGRTKFVKAHVRMTSLRVANVSRFIFNANCCKSISFLVDHLNAKLVVCGT
jgi:hypothetical protein